ncbi:hypothetical protein JOF42_002825 [Microbacterium phyllosphaerae]|uniref:DUF2510 domain-containing protein n=1 Tax=Microbacterium phyllosphaerae TaxID=124798 RepID=A0ABS4WT23_9MICO|nr:DUF2510 domain-containing protein [Microbacterium phyllosphaerae]MBP2379330.1 hypothetical protein [Microbacterium phyllosphaerae]
MTTPAGWYDDGSGRQRWWDGTQWTEHFAPIAEPAAPETPLDVEAPAATVEAYGSESADAAREAPTESSADAPVTGDASDAAAAATADSLGSVAAVETSWSEPATGTPSTPADDVTTPETPGGWTASDTHSPTPGAEQPAAEATAAEHTAPEFSAPESTAPGATAPAAAPLGGDVPPYANAAPGYDSAPPAYPGSAPTYPGAQAPQQGYPATPGYPGAAPAYAGGAYAPAGQAYGAGPGYPPAYATAGPTAPAKLSIAGLVGLGLAALGTILSCIPLTFGFGWFLLAAGFIVSLISIFLKGKKWPGITGLILSVVGTILAVVVAIAFVTSTVAQVVRDLPTAPPSSDSDSGTDDGTTDDGTGSVQVEEGTIGDTVTLTLLGGSGEVTVTEASWATSDGSSIPSTNGGYVTLETTWTGIEGTTAANPLFTSLETADGTEGQIDFYVTGAPNELLEPGQTVSGPITFDIAKSESYVFVVTDEAGRDIARISVTPTAG